MCFSQYLICARKNSTKTLCFGRKKTARTVLDQKCFSNIFIKFYWNKCVSVNIFNMCMEKFYQNTLFWSEKKNSKNCAWSKVFLFKFFIKFYWNKCVSVKFLICTCKNSIKTKCFGRKKQQELCLIKSVSVTFS